MDMSTLPMYTKEGFKKTQLPDTLYRDVAQFYNANYLQSEPESSDAIGTYISSEYTLIPARMVELSRQMKSAITTVMMPILEDWVKRRLELTALYGIREYRRGATLKMHVDRVETHHVSAIVNVHQHVDEDWPLYIYDHDGTLHEVYMQPGEVVLYESARLNHGRTTPLNGTSFASFFIHSKEIT